MPLTTAAGPRPRRWGGNYVEQVVRNLVANAAKYGPPGSTIEVSAERFDDEVHVRVLDRGPGIRGEDPGSLFSLFYRAPSTASQASGAGIGLFVCDQLIRAVGGRLWAKVRGGGGSEFGFALRRYADDHDLEIESLDAVTIAPGDGSTGRLVLPAPRVQPERAASTIHARSSSTAAGAAAGALTAPLRLGFAGVAERQTQRT